MKKACQDTQRLSGRRVGDCGLHLRLRVDPCGRGEDKANDAELKPCERVETLLLASFHYQVQLLLSTNTYQSKQRTPLQAPPHRDRVRAFCELFLFKTRRRLKILLNNQDLSSRIPLKLSGSTQGLQHSSKGMCGDAQLVCIHLVDLVLSKVDSQLQDQILVLLWL